MREPRKGFLLRSNQLPIARPLTKIPPTVPRIGDVQEVRWRTEYVPPEPSKRLLDPEAPRLPGSTAPSSAGRVVGPGLIKLPFTALADKAQRTYDADHRTLDAVSLELIVAAEKLLDAQGVKYTPTKTSDGFFALRIQPERTGHLLADPAHDLSSKLGGFRFLYSPGKLLARHSNGDHWRYTRELCLSHQSIEEMRLDPVTVHEIEHTVLSRAEEKGIPQLFTGNISPNGGSISDEASDVGGYSNYLSIQEVSAYSVQCEIHANRITDPKLEVDFADEAAKLHEMALWGAALSKRVADVAKRCQVSLAKSLPVWVDLEEIDTFVATDGKRYDKKPNDLGEHLVIERFQMKIKPFGKDEEIPASAPRVWAMIAGMPFAASVPLPQAADDVAAGDFLTVRDTLADHYARLQAGCEALVPEFEAIMAEANSINRIRPVERHHVDRLVSLVRSMREVTSRITSDYRSTFDRPV